MCLASNYFPSSAADKKKGVFFKKNLQGTLTPADLHSDFITSSDVL